MWIKWRFPMAMSAVTTFVVTFVLVSMNYGYKENFFYYWMRSWLVASAMVAMSIRFVGPKIQQWFSK
jgi:hypothetical protein